jgi:LacI family transcriptional regulator
MAETAPPSLRSLAREAGLSPMTISLALRNHPKIPQATRTRVQRLARSRQYRPDPEVAKLMLHLRTRRTRRIQAVIASLSTVTKIHSNRYYEAMAGAARDRASELGFGFDHIAISRHHLERPHGLQRILRSRGIEGVILLPMEKPLFLDQLLDWNSLSVVATSHSVLSPRFHCVLPDGFSSTLLMCRELAADGCRRIGLVLSSDMEERSRHNITAALLWHNTFGTKEPVQPLITRPGDYEGFKRWLTRERPDAVISETQDAASFLKWMGVLGGKLHKFRFAGISLGPLDKIPGIVQGEEEIGRTAVELLSGMLQRGEKGIPACPKLTLIPGRWKD